MKTYRVYNNHVNKRLNEEQLINFAKDRIKYGNFLPKPINDEIETYNELSRNEEKLLSITYKYEKNVKVSVKEAKFVLSFENWNIEEINIS